MRVTSCIDGIRRGMDLGSIIKTKGGSAMNRFNLWFRGEQELPDGAYVFPVVVMAIVMAIFWMFVW